MKAKDIFHRSKEFMVLLFVQVIFISCSGDQNGSDAYGNFEATEITVSSEVAGKLIDFRIEDGQIVSAKDIVGQIDTVQLYLKKLQVAAQVAAIRSKAGSVLTQLDVLRTQEQSMLREKKRVEELLKGEAATQKQLDDLNTQIDVLRRNMRRVKVQNQSVLSEIEVAKAQLLQLEDQIRRCRISNPINGVVLKKYAQTSELVMPGKALYKIANLSELELKAYVDGGQLSQIKIGQEVDVWFDNGAKTMDKLPGKISWVSSSAEFTPKIIQTKKERVNMVYAIKVKVKNDGRLKIGMPGELRWTKGNEE